MSKESEIIEELESITGFPVRKVVLPSDKNVYDIESRRRVSSSELNYIYKIQVESIDSDAPVSGQSQTINFLKGLANSSSVSIAIGKEEEPFIAFWGNEKEAVSRLNMELHRKAFNAVDDVLAFKNIYSYRARQLTNCKKKS